MLIVNPIYHTVFNYLMKNLDIAKGVISAIIGEEIDHLDFKRRENIPKKEKKFTFSHNDFTAQIKEADSGRYKEVLIELHKTYLQSEIALFIRYYGDRCRREIEMIMRDGANNSQNIPLIKIYFLFLRISDTLPGVIKVNRQYIDVLTGKEITERNEFIECLPHNSYVIHVRSLKPGIKTRLERMLSIFLQENFILRNCHLKDYPYTPKDELTRKILKHLEKASADSALHHQLELEDLAALDYDYMLNSVEAKLREQEILQEEKDKAIEGKDIGIDENQETIVQQDKALEANKKMLEKAKRPSPKKIKPSKSY